MKLSRNEVLSSYQPEKLKSNYQVEIFDIDQLLCSYKLNKIKKIVFFTHELDSNLFRKFIRIKNNLNANKIVVYCEFSYIDCPGTLEIVLNREHA